MSKNRICEGLNGIVTGASGGLGRSTALALAESGARVVAASRSAAGLKETVALAADLSGEVIACQADVTVEADIAVMFEASAAGGALDYVVNNAGAQVEKSLLETTSEDWEAVDATNSKAVFWVCQQAVRRMLDQGNGGSIVNIASVLSISADPMLPAYTASKHAVLGLTRSIAVTREYARTGIRANAVLPGDMETPMVAQYFASHDDPDEARRQVASAYPNERIADPMEVARVVRFLVSPESSYVNGSSIVVDGGILAGLYTSA